MLCAPNMNRCKRLPWPDDNVGLTGEVPVQETSLTSPSRVAGDHLPLP